ncbi:MAG: hypothetical protein OXB99_16950, partial [Acidimicrobiaceae bacterium]|nr:hypothetical protein [Acidimicrobiaceae bacterium]
SNNARVRSTATGILPNRGLDTSDSGGSLPIQPGPSQRYPTRKREAPDIEELLNGVTLGDQEAGALQWVVGRGYGIHFRHLWVWDWLHRECFAEFGEALSSIPERKAEMHVDFQRLDDLCMQLFRGSPNHCGNSSGMSRAAISMACHMAEERGRECSAQFEDGALVAGEFSIRDP